jgi:hypothetical protein
VVVSPRTVSSHSPNSSALLTVALRPDHRDRLGRWIMTSSQTGAARAVGEVVHLVHDHEAEAQEVRLPA